MISLAAEEDMAARGNLCVSSSSRAEQSGSEGTVVSAEECTRRSGHDER